MNAAIANGYQAPDASTDDASAEDTAADALAGSEAQD
jgi:hypothetical protein